MKTECAGNNFWSEMRILKAGVTDGEAGADHGLPLWGSGVSR